MRSVEPRTINGEIRKFQKLTRRRRDSLWQNDEEITHVVTSTNLCLTDGAVANNDVGGMTTAHRHWPSSLAANDIIKRWRRDDLSQMTSQCASSQLVHRSSQCWGVSLSTDGATVHWPMLRPMCLNYCKATLYLPTVVAGCIIFYCWSFFLFLFFSFAKGSPRWHYRQGTFLALMVGYRCNFKNWVQNLGGDPPKFGGPNPQCCEPKLEDVAQTYSRNRPWQRVYKTGFKILGAFQKNLRGVKV